MTQSSAVQSPLESKPNLERRAAKASFFGTVIEYYDFVVYAFLAITISPLFFPTGDKTASLLSTLAVFGAGYAARPLGGIFFGWIGDRFGRRGALMSTVLTMGFATAALGLLPTYQQIGIGAAILLLITRLIQGFAAGGEFIGASTYVTESAPAHRRGFFLSLTPAGGGAGVALAPLVVGVMTFVLTPDQISAWGWRVPFLLSIPLLLVCLYYRFRLEDTPEFKLMVERSEIVRFPLREVMRKHAGSFVQVIVVTIAVASPSFLGAVYMNIYLVTVVGLQPGVVYWFSALILGLALPGFLISGRAVDRFGYRRVLVIGMLGCGALVYPMLAIMGATKNLVVIGLLYFAFMLLNNAINPPAYGFFIGAFPGPVRYTGAAVGVNIGNIVGVGLGPYFAEQLVASTGNPMSPGLMVIGALTVGLVTLAAFRRPNTVLTAK
ncbi:MFS transporter [Rhodococcus sp. WS4]|nr:MFS transporter [Rhodococcus sp. WS4]